MITNFVRASTCEGEHMKTVWEIGEEFEIRARAELAKQDSTERWLLVARVRERATGRRAFGFELPLVARPCPAMVALVALEALQKKASKQPSARTGRASSRARGALLRRARAGRAQAGKPGYECPMEQHNRALRMCVGALVAARHWTAHVRGVAAGVDTLELFTTAPIVSRWVERLEGLRKQAENEKTPAPVEIGGLDCVVEAWRTRGAYLVRDASGGDLFTFRVRPEAGASEPRVFAECRSLALWSRGHREVGRQVRQVCAELCGTEEVDLQVSRVDLAVDFQGWEPTPEDRDRFVTRARRRARYWDASSEPQWDSEAYCESEARRARVLARDLEKAKSPARQRALLERFHRPPHEDAGQREYDLGARTFSGFAWGAGRHLSARLYNKSREIRVSRKTWLQDGVWQGAKEGEEVWRLEFQCRREALKQLVSDDGRSWIALESWEECANSLDRLWRFLSTRYVRHGWREAGERMVLSRPWGELVDLSSKFEGSDLERPELARHCEKGALGSLLPAVNGYLASVAAQLLEQGSARAEASYSELMASVLAAAWQQARDKEERTGRDCFEEVDLRRDRIRARRRWVDRSENLALRIGFHGNTGRQWVGLRAV